MFSTLGEKRAKTAPIRYLSPRALSHYFGANSVPARDQVYCLEIVP